MLQFVLRRGQLIVTFQLCTRDSALKTANLFITHAVRDLWVAIYDGQIQCSFSVQLLTSGSLLYSLFDEKLEELAMITITTNVNFANTTKVIRSRVFAGGKIFVKQDSQKP